MPPEPRRSHALRADVGRLFGVGKQQHDVALEARPRAAERVAEGEQQGDRARVVVGTRMDGTADHAEMIVVRDEHDPLGVALLGREHRAQVRTCRTGAALPPGSTYVGCSKEPPNSGASPTARRRETM